MLIQITRISTRPEKDFVKRIMVSTADLWRFKAELEYYHNTPSVLSEFNQQIKEVYKEGDNHFWRLEDFLKFLNDNEAFVNQFSKQIPSLNKIKDIGIVALGEAMPKIG